MTKAFHKIQKAALSLSYEDRLRLANAILITIGSEGRNQSSRENPADFESVLEERAKGPFEKIKDVTAWTAEIRADVDRKTAALRDSSRHG